MFEKRANFVLSDISPYSNEGGLVKTAATNIIIKDDAVQKIVSAEINKHPRALFFRAKAIVGNEMNSNADYFPSDELRKCYQSFVGCPFFTNHNNKDIEQAKGKLIHAEWVEDEESIYVIGFIDREAYPHICRGIEEEYMTGVSMGAAVDYSECSICHKIATDQNSYCPHIKNLKGKVFSGRVVDAKTGEIKTVSQKMVYEINRGVKFIELSGVADPACKSCHIQGIIPNETFLEKAASAANGLGVLKYAMENDKMLKVASQQEVDMLQQAIDNWQQVSIFLINNHHNIEPEFASQAVSVFSDMQEFVNEITGAGLAQLQDSGGADASLEGAEDPMGDTMGEDVAPVMNPLEESGATPVSETVPGTEAPVGSSSGTQPSGPPPKPTMANAVEKMKKISAELDDLLSKTKKDTKEVDIQVIAQKLRDKGYNALTIEKQGSRGIQTSIIVDEDDVNKLNGAMNILGSYGLEIKEVQGDDMQRRTPVTAKANAAKNVLSDNWKQMKEFDNDSQNSKTIDIRSQGEFNMKVEAQRSEETPEVITEKQLAEQQGSHPREETDRHTVTQDQLDGERSGDEPNVVTEKQLDSVERTDSAPSVTTQAQLEALRKNEEAHSVTQSQLDASRTNSEPNIVTEKQLDDANQGPWFTRKAASRTDIRTAGEHLDSVLKSVAASGLSSGATPDQALEVIAGITRSLVTKDNFLDRVTSPFKASEPIHSYASTLKYYASKGVAPAPVSKKVLAEAITASLHELIATDEKIDPETVVQSLEILADNDEGLEVVSSHFDALIKESSKAEKTVSVKDDLKNALMKAAGKSVEKKTVVANKEATHKITTTASELGYSKDQVTSGSKEVKSKLFNFATKASNSIGVKLGGVKEVNVRDDGTIEIRIWEDEEGDGVDLELNNDIDTDPIDVPAEGDPAAMDSEETLDMTPEIPEANTATPGAFASNKGKMKVEAQFGGMSGGGDPSNLGGAVDIDSEAPAGEDPVEALTQDVGEEEESTLGEQLMPGSICPVCGGHDTETGKADLPAGAFQCNGCDSVYSYHVMMEVLNPDNLSGQIDSEGGEPEAPEAPTMPVAASINIDKDSIKKLGAYAKKSGNICPACGMTECKTLKTASSGGKGTEYICPSCETHTSKDLVVSSADPADSKMVYSWVLDPKKAISRDECEGCESATKTLLAQASVRKMIKEAAQQDFPMSNCIERIASRYGMNSVAHTGPCKGKPLADCVCKQLEEFGMQEQEQMNKLASVYSRDLMAECTDHYMKEKGFSKTAACIQCDELKRLKETEADSNPFMLAFADDKRFTTDQLREMNKIVEAQVEPAAPAPTPMIGDPISTPEIQEVGEEVDETVNIEVSVDTANEIADAAQDAVVSEGDELVEGGELPVSAKSKNIVKTAGKPKVVEDVEKNVKAGVPRKEQLIENEKHIEESKVSIHSGDATMGEEEKFDANLPDVAKDSSYMGEERKVQNDMPSINNEIRGRVLAEVEVDDNGNIQKIASKPIAKAAEVELDDQGRITKIASVPEHVENMETEVRSGVPRGDAKIRNEKEIPEKEKQIPSGDAKMGEEQEITEKKVDIPQAGDQGFLGNEGEAQKTTPSADGQSTPSNSVKELGTVKKAARERQLRRILEARREKAYKVASGMVQDGVLDREDFSEMVQDLEKLELDRIESFAKRLTQSKKEVTASAGAGELDAPFMVTADTISVPVVQDNTPSIQKTAESRNSNVEKLAGMFTVGSGQLDSVLREDA